MIFLHIIFRFYTAGTAIYKPSENKNCLISRAASLTKEFRNIHLISEYQFFSLAFSVLTQKGAPVLNLM